jgi:large subunit ribosomal protein L25
MIDFDFGDKIEQAVMREVQYHPVREQILHIDFFRVINGKPVVVDIPVNLVGSSEGVKVGGKLTLSKRKLTVSGLAEHLPDELVIDVTTLELGKSIFVGDLKFDNLTLLNSPSTAICAVKMTRAARGAAAAAEA